MSGSQQLTSVTQIEQQRLGYNGISLTNFTDTVIPQIAEGSKVEVAGALFYFGSDDTIEDWSIIPSASTAYIKLVTSGTTVTAYWTSAAAVWRTDKQGWYATAASTQRYIGGCYKASAAGYAGKWLYQFRELSLGIDGSGVVSFGNNISLYRGADTDSNIEFASDADILWDESDGLFDINKGLRIDGSINLSVGADQDRSVIFASDANLTWDESEQEFYFNKSIKVDDGIETDGIKLKYAAVQIGEWDMDTTSNVNVAYSMANSSIVSMNVIIYADGHLFVHELDFSGSWFATVGSVYLYRTPSGTFDGPGWNATASTMPNRGYVYIVYEV